MARKINNAINYKLNWNKMGNLDEKTKSMLKVFFIGKCSYELLSWYYESKGWGLHIHVQCQRPKCEGPHRYSHSTMRVTLLRASPFFIYILSCKIHSLLSLHANFFPSTLKLLLFSNLFMINIWIFVNISRQFPCP